MRYSLICCFVIIAVIGFTNVEALDGDAKKRTFNVAAEKDVYPNNSLGIYFLAAIFFTLSNLTILCAQECQTGETKKEACNSCRCLNGNWACTRSHCLKKREAECVEGETKQVDCNRCFCAKGVFACTRNLCVSKREAIAARFNTQLVRERREVPVAADLKTTPCARNDYFSLDCNVCYCNTDGTGYLCTENTCEEYAGFSTTTRIALSNDSILIISDHGAQLLENYNSNDNSISRIGESLTLEKLNPTRNPAVVDKAPAIATQKLSGPNNGSQKVFSCTPGQTFSKECNTCTCTQDGKNAICTLKNCSPSDITASSVRPS